MMGSSQYGHRRFRLTQAILAFLLPLSILNSVAAATPKGRANPRNTEETAKPSVYDFLVRNRVPINAKIGVAKLSAVLRERYKVRSIVKVIPPEKTPVIKRQGRPVRFDTSKAPSELDLLRQNILAGEVIPFHPSEKVGDLELYFSKTQCLRIQIGYDMFYIRIGNNDCTFQSPALRKQLNRILHR